MPATPLPLLPWMDQQIADANGAPLVGGTLEFFLAGTDTRAAVYADPDGEEAMTNPVELDGSGRPTQGAIYVAAHGYKVIVRDIDGVEQYTRDVFEDVGAVFASTFGLVMTAGSRDVASGYTILDSDRFVTVNSTGGASPCVINLPDAADSTMPVTIKNLGTVALALTPTGNTIEGLAAVYTVPAAASPTFPTVCLTSDGVASWWITASHGL